MWSLEYGWIVVDVLDVHHQGHVVGLGWHPRVSGNHGNRQPVHRLVIQSMYQADRTTVVVHLEVRRFLRGGNQLVVNLSVGPGIRVGCVRCVYRRSRRYIFWYSDSHRTRIKMRRVVVFVFDYYVYL